jgi:uncharacterized SAM-binding protein YcdF (DUF218 family)
MSNSYRNRGSKMDGNRPSLELTKLHSSSWEAATTDWIRCTAPGGRVCRSIARCFSRRFAIVILAVAGLVGWLERESLLQEAADLWIVSDPLIHVEAIVILGGNSQTRPPVAADLYRRGLANKVLVSYPSDYERNRAALLKLGVPASAIEAFGKANTNTREEALALKEWAGRNGASVFVIPTEPFMTRRVRWIVRREFSGRPATIGVQPFDPPDYSHEGWWKTEKGSIAFQDEILKYLYYRWKY